MANPTLKISPSNPISAFIRHSASSTVMATAKATNYPQQ